jgi:DNA-binding NarL/FixJ family response regulator
MDWERSMKIRVILADDHALIRECICAILNGSPDLKVVAEANNGMDAVKLARELLPDVMVMDIGMKDVNGIEATRQIVEKCPSVKVLMLSMHAEKRFVVEALNAGAYGFILKNCASKEIVSAIRAVAREGFYLSPELQAVLGKDYRQRPALQLSTALLTQREREILVMLVEGNTAKEIAAKLQISAKTVETHRMHVMKKLHLNNIADLTRYAIREGLLLLD